MSRFKKRRLSDRAFGRLSMMEAVTLVGSGEATVSQTERLANIINSVSTLAGQPTPSLSPTGQLPESVLKQLAEMGIDPSDVQVVKLPPSTRSDDDMVQTVNGPVRWGDVPKGADGTPDPKWIEDNCACEEHTKKRAKKPKGGPNDGAEEYGDGGMTGGYI